MRLRAFFASALALALSGSTTARVAAADPTPSLNLRNFTAPLDPGSGVWVQPTDSPATGEWNVGLFTSYAFRPVTLRDASTNAIAFDVIKHQVTSDLVAGVGLWRRLHVGFDLPVLVYQTGDALTPVASATLGDSTYKLPGQGFGDLGIDAKLTLLRVGPEGADPHPPRPEGADRGGFGVALTERLSLPTGDTASFLGEGALTSEARILGEYRLASLGIHAALGFKLRGHTEDFACGTVGTEACTGRFGNEVPFGLGVSFSPRSRALGAGPRGRMSWFLEMNGHLPVSPLAPFKGTAATSLQLDLAARIGLGGDVSLLAGVQTSLLAGGGGVGDAPLRVVASLSWAPRSHDQDGDGIPDDVDRCPLLAEDFDGFEDHDGCPESDNDGDGIPDALDKCPNEPEDYDGFQDADGCPDPDNDQDHIPDAEDACPNEPGPPNPDPKKNGCPVHDRDGDGIPDERDACPDEPGPANADPLLNGCPPGRDSDGDGIPDSEDACPSVKGVRSANPKENGCPDPDPDKDTFIGDEDKCPNDPETWNGYQDVDGCPDQAPGPSHPLVTVKPSKGFEAIEVSRAIAFKAGNEIEAASLLTLRAVASELVKHPSWKILVGVRPSPKGTDADARARAIVTALRRYARREHAADTASWATVKAAPRAAELGVGFVLVTPIAPTPAKKP